MCLIQRTRNTNFIVHLTLFFETKNGYNILRYGLDVSTNSLLQFAKKGTLCFTRMRNVWSWVRDETRMTKVRISLYCVCVRAFLLFISSMMLRRKFERPSRHHDDKLILKTAYPAEGKTLRAYPRQSWCWPCDSRILRNPYEPHRAYIYVASRVKEADFHDEVRPTLGTVGYIHTDIGYVPRPSHKDILVSRFHAWNIHERSCERPNWNPPKGRAGTEKSLSTNPQMLL